MQLTRESIITAAVEILDTYGLGDMTMRRLAKHLGVVPGAIYWHLPNKQSLLEAIAEEIVTPIIVDPTGVDDWETSTIEFANALRASMMSHRDGAELVSAALPMGQLRNRIEHRIAQSLELSESEGEGIQSAASTLLNFIMGATMNEQSALQLAEVQQPDEQASTRNTPTDHALEFDRNFQQGLSLFVAGIKASRPVR